MCGVKKSDQVFFDAFVTLAEKGGLAAECLQRMISIPSIIPDLSATINALEHDGDQAVRAARIALRSTWITPFDRNDIMELINKLDDTLDMMHAISQRFTLFEIQEMREEAAEFAKLIREACTHLENALKLIQDMKNADEILKAVDRVDQVESAGDALYRRSIARLYKDGNEPLYVMKWAEMFEKFEEVLDLASDVADEIQGVVMEYA